MKSKEELKEIWLSWRAAREQAEDHLRNVKTFERDAKKRYEQAKSRTRILRAPFEDSAGSAGLGL